MITIEHTDGRDVQPGDVVTVQPLGKAAFRVHVLAVQPGAWEEVPRLVGIVINKDGGANKVRNRYPLDTPERAAAAAQGFGTVSLGFKRAVAPAELVKVERGGTGAEPLPTGTSRAEIVALAKRAQTDLAVARGTFRALAQAEGFEGATGGWIYRDGKAVTQGWQGLADLVARGSVRFAKAEAAAEAAHNAQAVDGMARAMAARAIELREQGRIVVHPTTSHAQHAQMMGRAVRQQETYRLTRVLPNGEVKQWPEPFTYRHKAAEAVARCLYDNYVTPKLEAQEFGQRFYNAPIGEMVAHGSGYRFYLEQV